MVLFFISNNGYVMYALSKHDIYTVIFYCFMSILVRTTTSRYTESHIYNIDNERRQLPFGINRAGHGYCTSNFINSKYFVHTSHFLLDPLSSSNQIFSFCFSFYFPSNQIFFFLFCLNFQKISI